MADREEPDYGKDLGVKLWLGLGLHGFRPGVDPGYMYGDSEPCL